VANVPEKVPKVARGVLFTVLASTPPANWSNNSPTSEALKDLLAVKVMPFTVTVSPLLIALKVTVIVDAVPEP